MGKMSLTLEGFTHTLNTKHDEMMVMTERCSDRGQTKRLTNGLMKPVSKVTENVKEGGGHIQRRRDSSQHWDGLVDSSLHFMVHLC